MATGMNVQDVYLNKLRKSPDDAVLELIDGTERRGKLVVFDQHAILLSCNGWEKLIYKNNILCVYPAKPTLKVFTEDPEWARNHVYGPEQHGVPPAGSLTLGENGTYRMPILQRPHQTYYPS